MSSISPQPPVPNCRWVSTHVAMAPKPWLTHMWLNNNTDEFVVSGMFSTPEDPVIEIFQLLAFNLNKPKQHFRTLYTQQDEVCSHPNNHSHVPNVNQCHYPPFKSFGVKMSGTTEVFVRESNNFEYSLEQEYIKHAGNDPTSKVWETFEHVKIIDFVEAVVAHVTAWANVTTAKRISYRQHTNWKGDKVIDSVNTFREDILLGDIGGNKFLCSVLGGYSNTARVVFVTNNSSWDAAASIERVLQDIRSIAKQHSSYIPENKATFNIIVQDGQSLGLREFEVAALKDMEQFVELNYNDDFAAESEKIINNINNLNKGITLLHGVPGSGKTNYIRYLAHMIKGKPLIYIPPEMTAVLAQPSFIQFVMDNQKSVFIVEDAESILRTRDAGDNSAVANMLNMSDGIIGDAVQCQFICTFNCEYSEVDSALKRKGRLNSTYKFEALTKDKAQGLVDKLYPDSGYKVTNSMTLAEIYNLYISNGNECLTQNKNPIGF